MSDVYDGIHECVLCGEEFTGFGHNPEPLASYEDGRACDSCNAMEVIPARLGMRRPSQQTPGGGKEQQ